MHKVCARATFWSCIWYYSFSSWSPATGATLLFTLLKGSTLLTLLTLLSLWVSFVNLLLSNLLLLLMLYMMFLWLIIWLRHILQIHTFLMKQRLQIWHLLRGYAGRETVLLCPYLRTLDGTCSVHMFAQSTVSDISLQGTAYTNLVNLTTKTTTALLPLGVRGKSVM